MMFFDRRQKPGLKPLDHQGLSQVSGLLDSGIYFHCQVVIITCPALCACSLYSAQAPVWSTAEVSLPVSMQ